MTQVTVPIVLTCFGEDHHTWALVDSGAARTVKLLLQVLSHPITVLNAKFFMWSPLAF